MLNEVIDNRIRDSAVQLPIAALVADIPASPASLSSFFINNNNSPQSTLKLPLFNTIIMSGPRIAVVYVSIASDGRDPKFRRVEQ